MLFHQPRGDGTSAEDSSTNSFQQQPPPPPPPPLPHPAYVSAKPRDQSTSSIASTSSKGSSFHHSPALAVHTPRSGLLPTHAPQYPTAIISSNSSIPLSPTPGLTSDAEVAMRARGRELLAERRRSNDQSYSAATQAALLQRGTELLQAARAEAAANGGHHVPAPRLSVSTAIAEATNAVMAADPLRGASATHPAQPLQRSAGHAHLNQASPPALSGAERSTGPSTAHTASAEGERCNGLLGVNPAQLHTGTVASTSPNTAASSEHVIELVAEVERLSAVVASQQAELSSLRAADSGNPTQSSSSFTRADMDAAKSELVAQFNAHMTQCEQANRDYWSQVSTQHAQEVAAVRQTCTAYEAQIATLESAQETERNLATAAQQAAQQQIADLAAHLAEQQSMVRLLEAQLADAEDVAARQRQELQHNTDFANTELEQTREHFAQLQQAYAQLEYQQQSLLHGKGDDEQRQARVTELETMNAALLEANEKLDILNAELLDANGKLESTNTELQRTNSCLATENTELQQCNHQLEAALTRMSTGSPIGSSGLFNSSNPFADTEAEDPFGAAATYRDTTAIAAATVNERDALAQKELMAAQRRITELEAANAELLDTNNKLKNARAAAATALPTAHSPANPFADGAADDLFGTLHGAATVAAVAAATQEHAELVAARQRIFELETANAELRDVGRNLKMMNAELQEANHTLEIQNVRAAFESSPAQSSANPFADAEAEDPFGEAPPLATTSAFTDDNVKLVAARERIFELETANADLQDANRSLGVLSAELQDWKSKLESEPIDAASPQNLANPFADADTEDLFDGTPPPPPAATTATAREEHAELVAARERIFELETANTGLRDTNHYLQGTNDKLGSLQTDAAPHTAHSAANPFADTEADDPFGATDLPDTATPSAEDSVELAAARARIADLEDALAEATSDIEHLQEDMEEKRHLIQALRAGEAALGSLTGEMMNSGSGWSHASSPPVTAGAMETDAVAKPLEESRQSAALLPPYTTSVDSMKAEEEDTTASVPALRARVAELTRALEAERQLRTHADVHPQRRSMQSAQRHSPTIEEMAQSHREDHAMEELGRQHADVQQRLALSEEARATLEMEVEQLRAVSLPNAAHAKTSSVSSTVGEEEQQPPSSVAAAVTRNPFKDADDDDGAATSIRSREEEEPPGVRFRTAGGVVEEEENVAAVATVRTGVTPLRHLPQHRAASDTWQDAGDNEEEEEGARNGTPTTEASFHIGPALEDSHSAVEHSDVWGEDGAVCGTPNLQQSSDASFARPLENNSHYEEEKDGSGVVAPLSLAPYRRTSARAAPAGAAEEDTEALAEVNTSVSTRVAQHRGGYGTAASTDVPSQGRDTKVEDSGAAMQELGRRYADAQHRLLHSEEARASLEAELEETRLRLAALESAMNADAAVRDGDVAMMRAVTPEANLRQPVPQVSGAPTALVPGIIVSGDAGDAQTDTPATEATSQTSSVPTAMGGTPTFPPLLRNSDGEDAPMLFVDDKEALQTEAPAAGGTGHSTEEEDGSAASLHNDDEAEMEVLRQRVVELEAELEEREAEHDAELAALAEDAADRIAELVAELEEVVAAEESGRRAEAETATAPAATKVDVTTRTDAGMEHRPSRLDKETMRSAVASMSATPAEAPLQVGMTTTPEALEELQTRLRDTADAFSAATDRLMELTEAKAAAEAEHAAALAQLTEICQAEIAEHDALLQERLEEQAADYDEAIQLLEDQHQEQLQLLSAVREDVSHLVEEDSEGEKEMAAAKGVSKPASSTSSAAARADDAAVFEEVEAAAGDDWRAMHDALQIRFTRLQRDYDDLLQDTAALQRRAQEEQASVAASRSTREAAAEQLVSVHARLTEMSGLLAAAQADAQDRARELQEAMAQHATIEAAMKSELSSLSNQLQSSKTEMLRMRELNDELTDLLQQGATGVEATLRDRDQQRQGLEEEVRRLKLELAATHDKVAEEHTRFQEQREAYEQAQQRLLAESRTQHAVEAQLREMEHRREEDRRAAAQSTDRAAKEAEQARAAAQQAMAEQHSRREADIASLQSELDTVRAELEVAQTVAATVPLEEQRHQADLARVRDRMAEAVREQQELRQQLARGRAEADRQRRVLRGANLQSAADGDDGSPAGSVPTTITTDAHVNAMLKHVEELEESLREATTERDTIQQERDRLTMQVKSAARVTEVKEQVLRRQEDELRAARVQLSTLRDDLSQRVQLSHALQLDMDHLQEQVSTLASANAELQERHYGESQQQLVEAHVSALLWSKTMSIPRALEHYMEGLSAAFHKMLETSAKDRTHVYGRCAAIEQAAAEAMAEAEAQHDAYETALADATSEQGELKEMIEQLERALNKAESIASSAVQTATSAREELEHVQRQTREEIFQAQRDLQVAELQHADTLHSLSLLQDEVSNTAALIMSQKATYERHEVDLNEEVAQLKAELESRKASMRLLQQSTDETHRTLEAVVEEAGRTKESAVREAQALRAQLDRAVPRLVELEEAAAQRNADLMDTAQQLSALHRKSSSTEEVSRRHITELNTTMQELLQAHTLLQRQYTTTEANAERLKTQLETTTQELTRTSTATQQQATELEELHARLKELETRTTRASAEDQTRLRDAERRLHGLEQRNAVLQHAHKSAQETLQSLQLAHETTTGDLQRLTEASAAQDQQRSHQLQLARDRVTQLETERQELLTSEQQRTQERDASQRACAALQHQLEHVQQHLDDTNAHNRALNGEMVELKATHAAEVDRLRETLASAQKELTRCRQLLSEAETQQVDQEGMQHSLSTELVALRKELKSSRTHADKLTSQLQNEKAEREATTTRLQSQLAEVYEDVRVKQDQIRATETTSANQQDAMEALRQDLTDAELRLRRTRQELSDVQEAAAAAKEHHRRDRFDLQAKLHDAEDTAAEVTQQHAQHQSRMATKVEQYEVAELALRAEVADLHGDVARLEEALRSTTYGKDAAEDVKSRQIHAIAAAEAEVQALRTRAAEDLAELTALKVQLQQRTAELERVKRDAAAQLASERQQWGQEHAEACDALGEALRAAQQATQDAREGRERALATLARKQAELAAAESELRELRGESRDRQRRLDTALYQLSTLQGMSRDAAADLGVTLEDLLGVSTATVSVEREDGAEDVLGESVEVGSTGSSKGRGSAGQRDGLQKHSIAPAVTVPSASTSVQAVLDELLRRLSVYTYAANTLDNEDAQLDGLSRALAQQQDAVDVLLEVSAQGATVSVDPHCAAGAGGGPYGSSVTPLRPRHISTSTAPGLINSPIPLITDFASAAATMAVNEGGAPRVWTAAQRSWVQQISQSSSTYAHRVEDHIRTAQRMLRSIVGAVGAQEVMGGTHARALSPESMSRGSVNRPSAVALAARQKLLVSATTTELHRRTATLTRALDRLIEHVLLLPSGASTTADAPSTAPSAASEMSPSTGASWSLQQALLDLRRQFTEAERYVLQPFNELLCGGTEAAAASSAASAPRGSVDPNGQLRRAQAPFHPSLSPSAATAQHREDVQTPRRVQTPQTTASGAPTLPLPPALATTQAQERGGGGGGARRRSQADDSTVVAQLSPIPTDAEPNWF